MTKERDEQAFEAFIREDVRRRIIRVTTVSVACFAFAWLLGRVFFDASFDSSLGVSWLALMTVFAGVGAITFRYLRLAARHPIALASVFQAALGASAGAKLVAAGNPDQSFFYAVFLLPPLGIGLPMPLGPRIVVSLAGPAGFTLACLASLPFTDVIYVPIIVGTATTVVSIMLGHHVHVSGRARFFAERELRQHREELARHARVLEREVEQHTQELAKLGELLQRADVDREEVARALHDDLGQLVVRVRMELEMLEDIFPGLSGEEGPKLEHLNNVVELLDESVRIFIERLRDPAPVDDLGQALEALVAPLRARSGMSIETEVALQRPLGKREREVVYRFVQETLTNAFKHADAASLVIAIAQDSQETVARVRDDGRGFDADAVSPQSLGLDGLRARAQGLGGALRIESSPGEGTCVRLHLPQQALPDG